MAANIVRQQIRRALPAILFAVLPACAAAPRPAVLPAAPPASLAASLDSIFADTALQHAHWGVLVKSLTTGETLYERNSRRAFVPASTMKLVTGAVALSVLGPDYRYRTTFSTTAPVRAGVLQGDLIIRGSGDPTLSERFSADPRATMRAWADSLRTRGITRITGGIIGVDSAFFGPSLGAGWAWDDLDAYYAAPVGALQFNEGAIDLQVVPSRTAGEPAVVILDPATQYVHVNNRTVTTGRGITATLDAVGDPTGPVVTLTGSIPIDTSAITLTIAVRDPAGYFLGVLRETFRDAGVAVEGQALPAGEWPVERSSSGERQLFASASAPLSEILPGMMKPSQNWIAETLLRTIGSVRRGEGSVRGGTAVVDSVLRGWAIPLDGFRMADGSGLSRNDLANPDLWVTLLSRMRDEPNWVLWYSSLPSAGQSGTLQNRMQAAPLRGNVRAKTGTLTGVRGLAGYLETETRGSIVFAILLNNHTRSTAAVDRVSEAALRALYKDIELNQ
ncbi:MAG: D-alanyl-D-alanine carboxypeptidase/D-alanyl-D-alanine-endopeptidase, partial [Gemmatimonadetes bacterium]|nr:D-alanyl-D-alanine carboxypeptidase/D-alanyl-D-alanine-endopeptidase [Gemmatimonadota bacterium]